MSTALTASWDKQQPHTKALVYFKAGPGQAGRKFYARELYFGKPVHNPRQYGIDGLVRMVDKWAGLVATAVIYDLATEEPILKYLDGKGWL